MYQVIENKEDFSKLMENLPKELKVLKIPEFNKKLEMVVNVLEANFGENRDNEDDVEGYIIILYGKKKEVLDEYKKVLAYRYSGKENKKYEYRKQALN
ncbi:hypothetical protein [Eubacterium ventriosum]|jgi:hypothetical protein|uniref:hypothetical protein n=1 Tax=Eubacterium ventriosum TaxID=39496 RepID=UPI003994DA6F